MMELKSEYREHEPRPELPPGMQWRKVIVERPGNDVREFDVVYRPVKVTAPEVKEASKRISALIGSPWEKAERREGAILPSIVGETYVTSTHGGIGHRKVILHPDGVWVELDNGKDGAAHWLLSADLAAELRQLFQIIRRV